MHLETKLHAPLTKPGHLVRERLLSLIHANLDKRLISVVSGAGYGKTTLMAQLLERGQLPAMYLSLEASDGDLDVFVGYLLSGLRRLVGSRITTAIGQSLLSSLERLQKGLSWRAGPAAFVADLINILSTHHSDDLYIILDDYHWLSPQSGVHTLIDFLVDRMPSHLHLIVCSRSPLPLPSLPKWRSKLDAFELDQGDLAFGDAELRALISKAYRTTLPEAELARVLEQTQGWVTGIHLIFQAAGLHKSVKETLNGYVTANRPLFEYFASEIVGKEEETVRRFLHETSVFDVLTGEACDFLLQSTGSARLLRDLESRNIFLSETSRGEYRHHPLFRNYLRDGLSQRARLVALNSRAALYCSSRGLIEEAIDHHIQAGEFDRAAGLIAEHHDNFIGAARFDALGRWFSALPQDIFAKYPPLLLPLARWQLEQRRPLEQRQTLRKAVLLLDRAGDRADLCRALLCLGQTMIADRDCRAAIQSFNRGIRLCPRTHRQLLAELHNTCGQAWLWMGRYRKAGFYYRRALNIARSASLPLSGQAKIIVDLSVLHARLGEYKDAYRSFLALITKLGPDHYYLGIGSLYGSAAKAAMTVGELAQAGMFIARGRKICQGSQDLRSLAMLSIMEAQLDLFRRRWDQAGEQLQRLEETCGSLGSREYLEAVWRIRAQLLRYQNRLEEAAQQLANFGDQLDRPPVNYIVLRGLSEKGFLDVAAGRMAEAGRTAAAIGKSARLYGDKLGLYYSETLLALVHQARPALSRKHLRQALALAEKWGYLGLMSLELHHNSKLKSLWDAVPRSGRASRQLSLLMQDDAEAGGADSKRQCLLLRLFGQLELSFPSGKKVFVRWRTRKAASLFAYLACNRERFCHTEELIGALWSKSNLSKAKGQLYQTICLMRENLRTGLMAAGICLEAASDPIVRQSQSYQLMPHFDLKLDTEELERLWKEHIQFAPRDDPTLADHCQKALALSTAPFLSPFSEPWCEQQRERYRTLSLAVKERLARCLETAGQPHLAAAQLSDYLKQEPFAEHIRLQYWKYLLAAGNRREIAADHMIYARLLKKELGQSLSPELTSFLRSLP